MGTISSSSSAQNERPSRSDDELQKAAFWVGFELTQLTDAVAAMNATALHKRTGEYIACYESALLHLRSLVEFFFGKLKTISISPLDFVPEWDSEKELSGFPAKDDIYKLLSKRLVHLDWARVEDDPAEADIIHLLPEAIKAIARSFERFSQMTRPGQYPAFESALDSARQTAAHFSKGG